MKSCIISGCLASDKSGYIYADSLDHSRIWRNAIKRKCNDCGHIHEEHHRIWSEEIQQQTKWHSEGLPDIICCPKCDSTNISSHGLQIGNIDPDYKDGSKVIQRSKRGHY